MGLGSFKTLNVTQNFNEPINKMTKVENLRPYLDLHKSSDGKIWKQYNDVSEKNFKCITADLIKPNQGITTAKLKIVVWI